MKWNRRNVLTSCLGAAAFAATPAAANAATSSSWKAQRRVPYGAALGLADLDSDPRLGAAIAELCSLIAPVDELKWSRLRPNASTFAFERADSLMSFAQRNGLSMRGHTLVWYASMPEWTKAIDTPAKAERALVEHIETVVSRYRGRIRSWDVVNEAIPDVARRPTDRRPSLWFELLGDRHFALAFRTAAAADPQAQLALNEYDVEFGDEHFPAKRAAFRNLVFRLLDAGAPLHAVGLQCHLRGAKAIDRDGLGRFVGELHAAGVKVLITELDVLDNELPPSPLERDQIVARQVGDLLATVTAAGPLDAVLTWGISDRYSWIPYMFPRRDGLPNRPLPLDRDFGRKPFMQTIDRFTGRTA